MIMRGMGCIPILQQEVIEAVGPTCQLTSVGKIAGMPGILLAGTNASASTMLFVGIGIWALGLMLLLGGKK